MTQEIDIMSILQIDATVITGMLVLLTITNLTRITKEFWLPKQVAYAIIPFAFSASFAAWQLLVNISSGEGNFIPASLALMIIGFAIVISVAINLTFKKNWIKKDTI
ncbi:MAG TPA: hypothetical protein VLD38_07060 [Nitrosopumilaceae archaeon]|nr:hypothetical protein [Nitrosopumilaceae archaeon]